MLVCPRFVACPCKVPWSRQIKTALYRPRLLLQPPGDATLGVVMFTPVFLIIAPFLHGGSWVTVILLLLRRKWNCMLLFTFKPYSRPLQMLCQLKKAHAGVDFALLANREPADVDPRAIGTVQRSGDGCQIACVTWW